MITEFTDTIPNDISMEPVLISGSASIYYAGKEYLILSDHDIVTGVYEIKYQVHCSPFKQALLIDNLLAVGHEEHFYLFSINTNQNLLRLKLDGYFGHLYFDKDLFYVADATGLHCIDKNGNVCWANAELGIDGVIINEFTDNKISGSGEFDPPGGWKDFLIDRTTGNKTT